jgi:OOP family OmpA-OmpF porin
MVRIAEYASLRLDGRYRYDDNQAGLRRDDSFGDWVATAGLVIPIGGKAPVKTTRTYELSADTLFAFNKSNLSSQGVGTINNFARDLDQVTYDGVRVAGHTDPIGSVAFNQGLSERRAGTVQDQLVNQGVPAGKVSAAGYGKSNLKVTEAECAHAKGREALIACLQPNRRVEVTVEGVTEKK